MPPVEGLMNGSHPPLTRSPLPPNEHPTIVIFSICVAFCRAPGIISVRKNVHIVEFRRIPNGADDRHIAFVFNSPSLGAEAHAVVTVLRISEKRNKKYLHAIFGMETGEFRKLHVITDQNADFSRINIEDLDLISSDDSPGIDLRGRLLDLPVLVPTSIPSKEIGNIVHATLLSGRPT